MNKRTENKEILWRKELIPELREWNCNKLADLLAEEIVLFQDVDRALAGGLAE